jgi:hypothetical protein
MGTKNLNFYMFLDQFLIPGSRLLGLCEASAEQGEFPGNTAGLPFQT